MPTDRTGVHTDPHGFQEQARDPFVVRVAALPVSALRELRFDKSWTVIAEIRELQRWLVTTGEQLSERLYTVVGGLGTPELKPTVVALRRAVYGGRPLRARLWNPRVHAALPADLVRHLDRWQERLAERDERLARLPALLAAEQAASTERLRAILTSNAFRYGLVQGSPVLFTELTKWLGEPPGTAPDRQVLLRLVKYLARVTAKTSPYSTFTVAGLAGWDEVPGPAVRATGNQAWRSVVELNVWLAQRFAQFAIRHPDVVANLRLRVNPSLTDDGTTVRFLGAGAGTPLTTVSRGRALAESLDFVAANPGTTVRQLRARLSALDQTLADADVAAFTGRLVDTGLLHTEAPFADQADDHLGVLLGWLDSCGVDGSTDVSRTLRTVADELSGYPRIVDPQHRLESHERIYEALNRLNRMTGGPQAEPLPRKNLFHENAVFTAPVVACSRAAWQPVVDELSRLRGLLPLFDSTMPARRALADVFRATYPESAAVPWLIFYQEVNRMVSAGARAVRGGVDGATLRTLCGGPAGTSWETWCSLPYAREQAELVGAATALVRSGSTDAGGVVRVDPTELAAFAANLPPSPARLGSIACYVQLTEPDPAAVVLNTVGVGYGRGANRVVRLLGAAGAADQARGWEPYVHGPAGELMVESTGCFANNLNLRAPSTAYELDVPFTTSLGDTGGRIPMHDLLVTYDPVDGLLCLRSRRHDRPVRPVHNGLMGEFWLPAPVRHLVDVFGPPSSLLHSSLPLFFPRTEDPRAGGVRRLPRLDAGRVTLSRACWAFATAEVPRRRKGDSDANHWLRLADWLAGHGIPERFYVKVVSPEGSTAWTPEAKSRKPLYVDLSVWYLVRLLERTLDEGGSLVVVTEALPDLGQAPRFDDGRHVTEFVIELPGVQRNGDERNGGGRDA